jgi:tetratricopeptide (TPR) repeat protein
MANTIARIVVLGAALGLIFGRSLNSPFFFDDAVSVSGNSSIIRLWPLVGDANQPGPLNPAKDLPTAGRPLVNYTLALNYHFGGLSPVGYHLFNLALHLLSALLVMLIVNRILRLDYFGGQFDQVSGMLAFLVALLWAVHPLQTESVVYVTQRTELMVGFFYLATLYCSLRYWSATEWEQQNNVSVAGVFDPGNSDNQNDISLTGVSDPAIRPHEDRLQSNRTAWLLVATLSCLAGMACKEVMVTAPLVVLLFERTFIAGSFRNALRQSRSLYIGLSLGWFLLLALNYSQPRALSAGFHLGLPAQLWWFTQAKVFWMYLKLVVWPWPLIIHYQMPYLSLSTAWPWLLGMAVVTIATFLLLRKRQAIGFVGAWVLLILSPTLLVPILTEVAAERRMYLPLAALVTLVVVGGYHLLSRCAQAVRTENSPNSKVRWIVSITTAPAVLLAIVFSLVSIHRLAAYDTQVSLWSDALTHEPEDPVIHNELGNALLANDKTEEAISHYRQSLQLNPNAADAHNNLGSALFQSGKLEEANQQYQEALRLRPNNADIHNNLGNLLAKTGHLQKAIEEYQKAIQLKPDFAVAHFKLGDALAKTNQLPQAVMQYVQALRLKPDNADIHCNLANALSKVGLMQEAVDQYQLALQLKPDYADVHLNLGIAMFKTNQFPEAIDHFEQALRLEPDLADAHYNLGNALLRSGRAPEAIEHYQQAVRLNPELADAYNSLGAAHLKINRPEEAFKYFDEALRLKPNSVQTYANLARAYALVNNSDKAIATAKKAIDMARSTEQTELAQQIEKWLSNYCSRQAHSLESPAQPSESDRP